MQNRTAGREKQGVTLKNAGPAETGPEPLVHMGHGQNWSTRQDFHLLGFRWQRNT
jgi:hypothetical protein